jgi:transposase-like protein
MVVKEVESGQGLEFVRKKYDIGGSATIQKWIKAFGKNHLLNKIVRIENMDDKDKLKQLEQDNKKLKLALADAHMAKVLLEGVIEMANEEYKTDLKKSFGVRSHKGQKGNIK